MDLDQVSVTIIRASGTTTSYPSVEWSKYYRFNGQLLGQRRNTMTGATLNWYLPDHLGGQHMMVDASTNQVVSTLRYWPYGEARSATGTPPTDQRFTGQYLDPSTSLYYYGSRYYHSGLGGFVQPDPTCIAGVNDPGSCLTIAVSYRTRDALEGLGAWNRGSADKAAAVPADPQLLNRYEYARNNPLTYNDVDGEGPWLLALAPLFAVPFVGEALMVTALVAAVGTLGLLTYGRLRDTDLTDAIGGPIDYELVDPSMVMRPVTSYDIHGNPYTYFAKGGRSSPPQKFKDAQRVAQERGVNEATGEKWTEGEVLGEWLDEAKRNAGAYKNDRAKLKELNRVIDAIEKAQKFVKGEKGRHRGATQEE